MVGTSTATCLPSATALKAARNCHLGLAEAHVAADEPIRGTRLLHVELHVGDRSLLVRCLGVGEGLFKLSLPVGVGGKGVPRFGLAGDGDVNEVLRHVHDRLLRALLGASPLLGA